MKKYACTILLLIVYAASYSQIVLSHTASKKYNGKFIFESQLPNIFPQAKTIYYKGSFSKIYYEINEPANSNVIIITRNFSPSKDDITNMRTYVEEGGSIFIAASILGQELESDLDIQSSEVPGYVKSISLLPEKILPAFLKDTIFTNMLVSYDCYFPYIDTTKCITLGINNKRRPNFIQLPIGDGNIFIHLYPDIFTNLFLSYKNYQRYTATVLSFLPSTTKENYVYLNDLSERLSYVENSDSNPAGEKNFYSFIRNQPNLWAAFLVGLLCAALAILFAIKRKQRVVPIVDPEKNTTVEFAKTIGDLYFFHKNNADIANKKIVHWQDFVRHKYLIKETINEDSFWVILEKKSGMDNSFIKSLQKNVQAAKNASHITDKQLILLSNSIDTFYT